MFISFKSVITGILRDMSALPVINLNFGDVNDQAGERGNVSLGFLRCKWNINMTVPSCNALQQAGVTGTRFFMIDPDGNGGEEPIRRLCTLPDSIQPLSGNLTSIYGNNPDEYAFTNCGKRVGHLGPDEITCNNSYIGSNVQVRVVDGRQIWRVPRSGKYRVRAMAPSGYHPDKTMAGRGGVMQAEFSLLKDQEIWVRVFSYRLRQNDANQNTRL